MDVALNMMLMLQWEFSILKSDIESFIYIFLILPFLMLQLLFINSIVDHPLKNTDRTSGRSRADFNP